MKWQKLNQERENMNKTKLIKLLLQLRKQNNLGISLTELLVALVISGIVLTAAASGFINLLRANQDVESKSVRSNGLARALAFMQEDVKQAKSVQAVLQTDDTKCDSGAVGSTSAVNSQRCLKIILADGSAIYYGFKDISGTTNQPFLKPGILKRQRYNASGSAVDFNNVVLATQSNAWNDLDTTIADGLINTNSNTVCTWQGVGLATSATVTVYGGMSSGNGGFRFCLNNNTSSNRLVRIFLYGYTGSNTLPISTEIVTFGRSQ
ncbi:type II secretion system protein J [Geminocystis sp. NIES-3709]|uniref:PulJ/GspJ family protein n=1 Tax=Geminocystis sp. NIES-3709 TaxID=1617448 RepID=UPI0005FC4C8F|nr:prepilin-type N-terminal cleavage/methylation domain-containing protein [Geminocystis sp. NIES-3709]BAQ66801.1 filamentous haemagglutinin family outer membrane protein associated with VreARI signalling system [Geminocystis sp. NIES-3709]